jgi:glycosyltransferase involved in cell wall biosynthesis
MGKKIVYHFLLDHRLGGPHIYVHSLKAAIGDYAEFRKVTAGHSSTASITLINLRLIFKFLYPLEILLNIVLIFVYVLLGKITLKNSLFDVHGSANLAPIIAGCILRQKIVWHFHETIPIFNFLVQFGVQFIKSTTHQLIAVTGKCVEVFSLKDTIVLEAPVNLDFWDRSTPLNTDTNQPLRIVCTANLNPLKGQDILLKAICDIQENCIVTFVGQRLETQKVYSTILDQLTEQIRTKHPNITIEFLGWQDQKQVKQIIENSDLFVLPSRSEAHPIALVEAMAMGLIVIGTDVGGVSAIIDGPDVGFLVPKENPEEIYKAIQKISAMSIASRHKMGKRARQHIKTSFSPSVIVDKHLEVYESLFSSK